MNAVIVRTAIAPTKVEAGRTGLIRIDGLLWQSEFPVSAGEAASINNDAEKITEILNSKTSERGT